jgi:hypothetical protein
MPRYFSRFPLTQYEGTNVRDITRRSKVVDDIRKDPFIFLPYTVKDGEKPEDLAYYYYGSVDDTWLVLLANNITDPYTQWPMDGETFNKYFIEKYSEISKRSGFDVIEWGLNETIDDNIVYYYREIDKEETFQDNYFETSQSFVDISNEQIQELLDNKTVIINGIEYKLVKQ